MSPLETAIQTTEEQIAAFMPGTSSAPEAGSAGYFQLRALVIAHAFLHRVLALGLHGDVAACERLYRAGTVHFHKAVPPSAEVVVKETLTPAQQAAVASAIATGNL
jgi:hypothetical protein